MKNLFYLFLVISLGSVLQAAEPTLLVEANAHPWLYPIFTPDGKAIAFTTPDLGEIWKLDLISDRAPSRAARGDSIGRRFVFDPTRQDDRLVYRVRVQAHPDKPVRLISTSIHLFDPFNLSGNFGEIIGPYICDGQIYYRRSLAEPLINLQDSARADGAYLDSATHRFWVQDAAGNHLYDSPESEIANGFEISPDGSFAAVVASAPQSNLYLVSLRDGTRRDLGTGRWPSWSADSKRFVCLAESDDRDLLRVYSAAAGKSTDVPLPDRFNPQDPSMNSDGSRVLFTHQGSIYSVDVP